jgi:hypothetical protein
MLRLDENLHHSVFPGGPAVWAQLLLLASCAFTTTALILLATAPAR